jgi:hypothetical protein
MELGTAAALVEDVLASPGRPLEPADRTFFGLRFDYDFSRVTVHAGERAARSAQAIGARGYTAGDHVVLADAGTDRAVLAHELAHVRQQGRRPAPGASWRLAAPSDPLEVAAAVGARRTLSRRPLSRLEPDPAGASRPRGLIYRITPGEPPAPAPALPTAGPRRIHMDTSVIDQINRGNTGVAAQFKALKSQGAEISISVPAEAELTLRGSNVQLRAANKLLIEDLGLRRVASPGGLAERVGTYEKYATTGVSVQAKDMPLVEAAVRDGAEFWTFDTNLASQSGAVQKHLGLKIAPESGRPMQGTYDYARARKLLGLDPVTIAPDGTVIKLPPSGGRGGGGATGTGGSSPPAGSDKRDGAPGASRGAQGEVDGTPGASRGARGEGDGAPGAGRGAQVEAPGAGRRSVEAAEGGEEGRPRQTTGEGAGPETGGVRRALGSAALNLGAQVGVGLLQQALHDQILEDLGKLPKPKIDRRGAGEFLQDPATGSAMQLLDVLGKDLKPFTAALGPRHEQIVATAELELMATALLPGTKAADVEKRFARLDAIADELRGYDEQLTTVSDNLGALLAMEASAMGSKQAADQLIDALPKLFSLQNFGAEMGVAPSPDITEFMQYDSNLRYVSASIRITFADAHEAKAAVDRAIAQETQLREQLRKIWWNELALQLQLVTKEQAARAAQGQAPPSRPPAGGGGASSGPITVVPATPGRVTWALTGDAVGTLGTLRGKVSNILIQLRQTEAKLDHPTSKTQADAVFAERAELLEQYRETKERLDAFRAAHGITGDD